MNDTPPYRRLAAWSAMLLMGTLNQGCATYSPLPLARDSMPATAIGQLTHRGALPGSLSIEDIAVLALDNSPELTAARSRRGVARAEMLEAGIAPNPSLNANDGFLLGGPGTGAAIAGGLSQDLKGLITLKYRRSAADRAAQAVDADILWQEWQTVAAARQLAVELIEGGRRRGMLQANAQRLGDLGARGAAALAKGDTTLTSLAPDRSAEAAALQQLADLDRQQATARRDLNALLGLAPSVRLPLSDAIELPDVDPAAVTRALATLPDRRPDLIALEFGYQSQDARLRMAILSQFPLLAIGVSGGHDNSDVRYVGPQASLELPVFNRNQGNVAIERATRLRLHDEFSARLMAARAEVMGLLDDQRRLRGRLDTQRARQPDLDTTAERAVLAHRAGDLDERTLLDALSLRDVNRLDLLTLEQTLLQQQIVIATLAAIGMPPVTLDATAGAS